MGDSKKPVNQGEIMNMQNLGTGVYISSDKEEGEFISNKDIEIKAPRKGLTLDELHQYIHRPLVKNIKKDEPLTKSHFIKSIINKNDFIAKSKNLNQ